MADIRLDFDFKSPGFSSSLSPLFCCLSKKARKDKKYRRNKLFFPHANTGCKCKLFTVKNEMDFNKNVGAMRVAKRWMQHRSSKTKKSGKEQKTS